MKLFLSGYGRMGHMIETLALEKGWQIVGHADIDCPENYETSPGADVCIDFSAPGAQPALAAYLERTGTALVSGTTGLTEPDFARFRELGAKIPLIWAPNYSTGVAVLRKILEQYGPVLEDWDKEILELHHNQKVDAPSGTARLLYNALDPEGRALAVHGREGICGRRKPEEIGIFSLRGGTAAGEHTVLFLGQDETLELTHKASSRRIFAAGALRAAEALVAKAPGVYSLDDLIFA